MPRIRKVTRPSDCLNSAQLDYLGQFWGRRWPKRYLGQASNCAVIFEQHVSSWPGVCSPAYHSIGIHVSFGWMDVAHQQLRSAWPMIFARIGSESPANANAWQKCARYVEQASNPQPSSILAILVFLSASCPRMRLSTRSSGLRILGRWKYPDPWN
jgi:hypothetical protein